MVLKRSKPLFKVVSFEEQPADLLDRAAAVEDAAQPHLEEISRIVHEKRIIEMPEICRFLGIIITIVLDSKPGSLNFRGELSAH